MCSCLAWDDTRLVWNDTEAVVTSIVQIDEWYFEGANILLKSSCIPTFTQIRTDPTTIGQIGATLSLLQKCKVSPLLFYEFSWQILGIFLSFLPQLINFKRDFGELKPDSCTRFSHKSHFALSPPGKAKALALESRKYGVLFLEGGR